jgi:nickel transport protein
VGLTKEEIKDLIDDSLDRKLRPIVRMMTESQSKGPSVNEIVGGIGYIVGLMGVALYFKNRGKKS